MTTELHAMRVPWSTVAKAILVVPIPLELNMNVQIHSSILYYRKYNTTRSIDIYNTTSSIEMFTILLVV